MFAYNIKTKSNQPFGLDYSNGQDLLQKFTVSAVPAVVDKASSSLSWGINKLSLDKCFSIVSNCCLFFSLVHFMLWI